MKYYLELNLKYYHLKARKEDDGKVSNTLHENPMTKIDIA